MTAAASSASRHCEQVTRSRARNFFYGIRLLPPEKRRAMCAVYALARRIDDIGDGELPAERKLAALDEQRRRLASLDQAGDDPVLAEVAEAHGRFSLPLDAFEQLIDGVEMDVREVHYERFDELVLYCRCVAGSIGRLCLAVFGSSDPRAAAEPAEELGVALQLTNILRDVREDLEAGRVYLPAEDLRRFSCESGLAQAPPEAVASLVRFEAGRARESFERGLGVVPYLDARSASCVLAMAGIYRRLLDRIERDPAVVMQRRLSLPPWEKAWVAARSLRGAGARASHAVPAGARR
ncbi:MAG: presqualene diphosphate synthase HpnD [Thermoleophilaceae bacterium]